MIMKNDARTKFLLKIFKQKREYELRRENSLIEESGRMQSAFSFLAATVFMAYQVFHNALDKNNKSILTTKYIVVSSIVIIGFLLTSLIFSSIAQWRWKIETYGECDELEKTIYDIDADYDNKTYRIEAEVNLLKKMCDSLEKVNDRRVKLIEMSHVFFLLSIVAIVLSVFIRICN